MKNFFAGSAPRDVVEQPKQMDAVGVAKPTLRERAVAFVDSMTAPILSDATVKKLRAYCQPGNDEAELKARRVSISEALELLGYSDAEIRRATE